MDYQTQYNKILYIMKFMGMKGNSFYPFSNNPSDQI